jgi:SAM-dependent methyltransferase
MAIADDVCTQVNGDAFGHALRECWKARARRGAAFEVTERDDGFIYVVDIAYYFESPGTFSPLDRWACEQARGRVLDVGCGAGRHALALMAAGHEVIGLDSSPEAVAVARERGVNTVLGTLDAAPSLGVFDTVLLLGSNLGLLESRERAGPVLATLARATAPGGRLIGSSAVPYRGREPAHAAYAARNTARGLMPGQLRIRIRAGAASSPWFDYLTLSVDELRALTAGTPWRLSDHRAGAGYVAVLTRSG